MKPLEGLEKQGVEYQLERIANNLSAIREVLQGWDTSWTARNGNGVQHAIRLSGNIMTRPAVQQNDNSRRY